MGEGGVFTDTAPFEESIKLIFFFLVYFVFLLFSKINYGLNNCLPRPRPLDELGARFSLLENMCTIPLPFRHFYKTVERMLERYFERRKKYAHFSGSGSL